MERRVHLVVLVAAVVALAGCSGAAPGGPTTADGTDSGATTTGSDGTATVGGGDEAALQTSQAAIQSFSYPEGATPDGITDLDTLLNEHSSALSGQSFTLNGSTVISVTSGGASDTSPVTYTVRYDASDDEILTTVGGLTAGSLTTYTTGSTKYFRITNESGTEYGTAEPGARIVEGGPQEVTGEGVLRAILQRGNFTATGVLTRNGRELVRYNLTSVTTDRDIDIGERTFEGYLLVDSDGIIHEADLSVRSESGDFSITFDSHVEFTDIGSTTVEEPSWTDDAR